MYVKTLLKGYKMFDLRSAICASVLAVPMLLTAGLANAVTVQGSSSGTFHNIDNCENFETCRITGSANGLKTELQWGYIPILKKFGSTLTAVDRSWNVPTNANDQIVAELVWYNASSLDIFTPDQFTADYKLKINFTLPNASNDTEVFNLTISNPTNPTGDNISGLTMADLANLSFTLGGVVVSDLKYLEAGPGSFVSNVWYNGEGNTTRMYITADFTAVPEPGPLGLLAAGLIGLGVTRRRLRTR
jgi:hypothetical protein